MLACGGTGILGLAPDRLVDWIGLDAPRVDRLETLLGRELTLTEVELLL